MSQYQQYDQRIITILLNGPTETKFFKREREREVPDRGTQEDGDCSLHAQSKMAKDGFGLGGGYE